MTINHAINRYLQRYPAIALLSYVVVVAAMTVFATVTLTDLHDRYSALTSAQDLLQQLQGRNAPASSSAAVDANVPQGSPFLDGQTVTVAGAALLQRVADAVTGVGGNILSSQVDVGGSQQKPNFVSLIVSCDLDQSALQKLLYDLEAGIPFLFIDQLTVQSPQLFAAGKGGRLRVMLGVSGQWRGRR